jgi:hypothetical protein
VLSALKNAGYRAIAVTNAKQQEAKKRQRPSAANGTSEADAEAEADDDDDGGGGGSGGHSLSVMPSKSSKNVGGPSTVIYLRPSLKLSFFPYFFLEEARAPPPRPTFD